MPGSPAELAGAIQQAWDVAEAIHVWTAVALAVADSRGDWLRLGYETFEEYAVERGISPSTARKLRLIGATFGDRLFGLIDGAAEPPKTARLYVAAQRVRRGQVDADTGLEEARVHPQAVLIAMRDEEPDDPGPLVECSKCGDKHRCSPPSRAAR
jgi:hypothetical protein